MQKTPEAHAYLAGPDVFFPGAKKIGQQKIAYLKTLGIEGYFPLDNNLPPEIFQHPAHAAMAIYQSNKQMMLNCCLPGRVGIILVNMNPYHGPSMDVGTAFEAGFMAALALKNNVIIVGYTKDPRNFEDRVIAEIHGGKENITEEAGIKRGGNGNMIEAFGGADNLMITEAISETGGRICNSFEEAAQEAKRLFALKSESLFS